MSDTRTAIRLIIWAEVEEEKEEEEEGRELYQNSQLKVKNCPRNWLNSAQRSSAQSAEAWKRGGTLGQHLNTLLPLCIEGVGEQKIVVKFVKCEKRKLLRNI